MLIGVFLLGVGSTSGPISRYVFNRVSTVCVRDLLPLSSGSAVDPTPNPRIP